MWSKSHMVHGQQWMKKARNRRILRDFEDQLASDLFGPYGGTASMFCGMFIWYECKIYCKSWWLWPVQNGDGHFASALSPCPYLYPAAAPFHTQLALSAASMQCHVQCLIQLCQRSWRIGLGKGLGGTREWPWEPTWTQVRSTDPFPFAEKKRQEFYDDYLMQDNYKVKRFHALAKERGVPANLVSHALERKKARLVSIKPSSKVGNCNMRLLSFIIGIRLFVAHLAAPNQIFFLAPWAKSLPLAGSAHLFLCQSAVHWDKLYFGWCLGAQVFTALAVQLIIKQKELDTYGFIDSYVLKYILAPFGKPFGP